MPLRCRFAGGGFASAACSFPPPTAPPFRFRLMAGVAGAPSFPSACARPAVSAAPLRRNCAAALPARDTLPLSSLAGAAEAPFRSAGPLGADFAARLAAGGCFATSLLLFGAVLASCCGPLRALPVARSGGPG